MTALALLAALIVQTAMPNGAPQPPPFDPKAVQATQSAAVRSLQAVDERAGAREVDRKRAISAKPARAVAERKAARARTATPEGRMEAQAEAARRAEQPRVISRAAATDRRLRVQDAATGRRQAARVEAVERQARAESARMAADNQPPR